VCAAATTAAATAASVTRRQLRGNLPQAFVHGLLIEAATQLGGPSGV
jgi:hypothetical protein